MITIVRLNKNKTLLIRRLVHLFMFNQLSLRIIKVISHKRVDMLVRNRKQH